MGGESETKLAKLWERCGKQWEVRTEEDENKEQTELLLQTGARTSNEAARWL